MQIDSLLIHIKNRGLEKNRVGPKNYWLDPVELVTYRKALKEGFIREVEGLVLLTEKGRIRLNEVLEPFGTMTSEEVQQYYDLQDIFQ